MLQKQVAIELGRELWHHSIAYSKDRLAFNVLNNFSNASSNEKNRQHTICNCQTSPDTVNAQVGNAEVILVEDNRAVLVQAFLL